MDLAIIERTQDIMDMKKSLFMENLQNNESIKLMNDTVISPNKMGKV